MAVYLARKGDRVVYHTSKTEMQRLDGCTPELTVSEAEWEAASGLARIINGELVLGKTKTELISEAELTALITEAESLQQELADKDYKVVKAAEAGLVLAQTDPSLHQRREWCRNRITEIRSRVAALSAA